ncbi:MAG: iron dependent repressor, metal binding and dimerization domain protein [Planctomycetota bacterium]
MSDRDAQPDPARPLRTDEPAVAVEAAREAHARERLEDYVEAIGELVRTHGECRVSHLAKWFGVSHVTALRAVAGLQEQGLATTEPHQPIALTAAGEELAGRLRERHDLVFRFLLALGVDGETAAIDAEGIEHHLSDSTLLRIAAWIEAQDA